MKLKPLETIMVRSDAADLRQSMVYWQCCPDIGNIGSLGRSVVGSELSIMDPSPRHYLWEYRLCFAYVHNLWGQDEMEVGGSITISYKNVKWISSLSKVIYTRSPGCTANSITERTTHDKTHHLCHVVRLNYPPALLYRLDATISF